MPQFNINDILYKMKPIAIPNNSQPTQINPTVPTIPIELTRVPLISPEPIKTDTYPHIPQFI